MGEALSTLTTTCAWFWENSRPRLISFKSMFLFLLFLGKARPSFHGHFIRGHVQDDAERNSPACPLRKQGYLDHLLGAVTWLSYASTMLGHSLLPCSKKKEKSSNPPQTNKQQHQQQNQKICISMWHWGCWHTNQVTTSLTRARLTLSASLSSVKTGCSKGDKPAFCTRLRDLS